MKRMTICKRFLVGKFRRIVMPGWMIACAGALNSAKAQIIRKADILSLDKSREMRGKYWLGNPNPFMKQTGWVPKISLQGRISIKLMSGMYKMVGFNGD